MSTAALLVPYADTNVDINDSDTSQTSIQTDNLSSCIGFLLDFKLDGVDRCLLSHYIFSIEETNLSPLDCLIKIFQFISGELNHCLKINLFVYEHTTHLSNLYLLIAGGDPHASKFIHDSLSLLNSNSNDFYIKTICTDADAHYLYDNLKNRVTIIKSVSKILKNKEESAST